MFVKTVNSSRILAAIAVIIVVVTLYLMSSYRSRVEFKPEVLSPAAVKWSQNRIDESGLVFDVVPNIIHYVLFGDHEISFVHFISLLSVLKNQRPELIYIHCDCHQLKDSYYRRAVRIANKTNTKITVRYVERPTEIFGNKLREEWSLWHSSDIMRIRVLKEFGGVYLDRDVYVVRPLNQFFENEMTLDFDASGVDGYYINGATLIAQKNARYLQLWENAFLFFDPNKWSYLLYSGTQLMKYRPELVHRVKEIFAADGPLLCPILFNTYDKNWQNNYYTIHMFVRGNKVTLPDWCFKKLAKRPEIIEFNETNVYKLNITFAEMVRLALDFEKKFQKF